MRPISLKSELTWADGSYAGVVRMVWINLKLHDTLSALAAASFTIDSLMAGVEPWYACDFGLQ